VLLTLSSKTFSYLRGVIWRLWLVMHWLRRIHGNGREAPRKDNRYRYCDGGWWRHDGGVKIYDPAPARTTRYRYRGTTIPSPWPSEA
jgi:RNA-directed DNA polymerase